MGKGVSKLPKETMDILLKDTYYSEDEINEWHKGFLSDCPSGLLSEIEFIRIYESFFPNGNPNKFASLVFQVFDENRVKFIQNFEIIFETPSLSVTTRGNLDEKLIWAFRLYDLNNDGYIAREEMYDIVESIFVMVGNAGTKENPLLKKKQPAVKEPSNRVKAKIRVDKIFKDMDKNNDNKLTLEEFKLGARNDPKIVEALNLGGGKNFDD